MRAKGPMLQQLEEKAEDIQRLAKLSRIRSVFVFGSVARGTETAASDVDLLLDPEEDMSLFDLAQFAREVEKLLGRKVDTVSRRALRPEHDAIVLAEAVPLWGATSMEGKLDPHLAAELIARRRAVTHVDPMLLRQDIDEVVDTAL